MKVVRLLASRTGRLYQQEMFLVLIFTRGCVDLRAVVRAEGNMSMKNSVTSPGIDPETVLNHYATPSIAKVKERVQIHLYSPPPGPSWLFLG